MAYTHTYNKANRLKTVTSPLGLLGAYTYNGRSQLGTRAVTNSGAANGTTHYIYDQWGNVLAEVNASGQTVREYIWLVEAEIAPTWQSRAQVDRPLAVVSGVDTGSPQLLMVHVDHLHRPVNARMRVGIRSAVEDDRRQQGVGVGRALYALGCAAQHHGERDAERALPGPVVPARSGPRLQLASPLRPEPRPLHPARSAWVCGWAECVRLCPE